MSKLLWLVGLGLMFLAACGPACTDSSLQDSNVQACENGNISLSGYCTCAVGKLFDSHSCQDVTGQNVSLADLKSACEACGGLSCDSI